MFRDDEEDDYLNMPVLAPASEPQNPMAMISAPTPAATPAPMNPLVKDYLAKKFNLGEYTDENRQKLAEESKIDFGDKASAALAAIGAGFMGKDAGAAGQEVLKAAGERRQQKLSDFDKGRAGKIQEFGLNRDVEKADREDKAYGEAEAMKAKERDPRSAESKIAQAAAVKMGYKGDASKLTAEQFKTFSPAMEKIYQVEANNQTRRDALNAKKEAELAKRNEGQTEGRKAADKDYAKDYNDFTGGGATKANDGIAKLKAMREEMSKDNGLIQAGGGPISGSLPDLWRTQASIARRDNIVSVANSALKATFGGQLSDGERKALANEFYNDKLSNAENLKIIDRKIAELENGVATQTAKADYFTKKGSLTGFQPNLEGHLPKEETYTSTDGTKYRKVKGGWEEIVSPAKN